MSPRDGARTGWEQKEEERSVLQKIPKKHLRLCGNEIEGTVVAILVRYYGRETKHPQTIACFVIPAFNGDHMHSNFIAVEI